MNKPTNLIRVGAIRQPHCSIIKVGAIRRPHCRWENVTREPADPCPTLQS